MTHPISNPPKPRTAAALIIGNELLSGKINEQNLVVLARTLRSIGISLRRVAMVPDEIPIIANEVASLASSFDILFTSGGLGPTHDDVTVAAVAQAFNTHTEDDQPTAEAIRQHFGDNLKPGHLLMARVPHGCKLVARDEGGWPTILMNNVWLLPGVPEVFCARLQTIKKHLTAGQPFVCSEVYTRIDEGSLVPLLNQVVTQFPNVDVGSYPTWDHPCYETKLTFDGTDASAVEAACRAFIKLLPEAEPIRVDRDSGSSQAPVEAAQTET
ncbi:MAG: molybdopterin-binding protein [Polyangiaceae bacterium]|nr:molybdopterin-binding protein [Polyangiaceae bacterium]